MLRDVVIWLVLIVDHTLTLMHYKQDEPNQSGPLRIFLFDNGPGSIGNTPSNRH